MSSRRCLCYRNPSRSWSDATCRVWKYISWTWLERPKVPTKLGTQIRTNSSLDEIQCYVHIFPEPWTKLKWFDSVKSLHIVLVQGIKKTYYCWTPLNTVGDCEGVGPIGLPLTTFPLEACVLGHLGVELWLMQRNKEWRWDGCSVFSVQDLTDLFLWGWFFPVSLCGW